MPTTPRLRPRHFVLATTLVVGTLLATVARAAPPEGRRGGPCAELACTEDQEQQLHDIFRELRTDLRGEHEQMRALHERLAAEFKKDRPGEATMKKVYAKIDRIHAVVRERRHDAMMEVHAVLTPVQRAKAAEHLMRGGPPHHEPGRRNRRENPTP